MGNQPPLEASIEIAAPPAQVWATLSDLKAMRDLSPELIGTWMSGRPTVGRRAVNLNRRKGFLWPTTSRITRWKDPSQDGGRGALAFQVLPTDVEWSYELEPTPTGTLVTERRTAVTDPSRVVRLTAKLALGGAEQHDVELRAGMDQTLRALKSHLER